MKDHIEQPNFNGMPVATEPANVSNVPNTPNTSNIPNIPIPVSPTNSTNSPKKDSKFRLFMIIGFLLGIIILAVSAIVLIKSLSNEPEPAIYVYQEFNPAEPSDGFATYIYVSDLLEKGDVYEGAIGTYGGVDACAAIGNLEDIIQENSITDEKILVVFEFAKAELFVLGNDLESARDILDKYEEDKLDDSQIYAYYHAKYKYHKKNHEDDLYEKYLNLANDYEGGHGY